MRGSSMFESRITFFEAAPLQTSRVMSHLHVFVVTLFDYTTFLSSQSHFPSYHLDLPPAHQLHLPRCGG